MKKLFFIIFATFVAISATYAQDTEYFQFKGIPINGSISNFGKQLEAEGFTKINANSYRGKFLRTDSVVTIVGDDDNMVWRVAAFLATTDTWSTLESAFNNYVNLYKEKYGTPHASSKKFTSYTGDHSGLKMSAIMDGECDYSATWNLPQGSIEVRIVEGSEYKTGCIRIIYTDNANKNKVHQSDLDEI